MSYAIMRCQKIKNYGSFGGAVQHCFRERETPNADAERTPTNKNFFATSEAEAFKALRSRLPEKVRKNGVIAIEYTMTASPEFFNHSTVKQQEEFFERSVGWLKEKYGAENVIVATVHRDETTPHLSAFVVPIDNKGKLNARSYIGGRDKLQHDQDTFALKVADLGLERGIKGSKAKHTTISQYYKTLNQSLEEVKITADDIKPRKTGLLTKETTECIAERLNASVNANLKPYKAKAQAYRTELERRIKSEAEWKKEQDRADSLARRAIKAESVFKGLTQRQIDVLIKTASDLKQKNKELIEQQKPSVTPPERSQSNESNGSAIQRVEDVSQPKEKKYRIMFGTDECLMTAKDIHSWLNDYPEEKKAIAHQLSEVDRREVFGEPQQKQSLFTRVKHSFER